MLTLLRKSIRTRAPDDDPDGDRIARTPSAVYLHDFIYGAIDGTVTTFAVVSGVEGANLEAGVVIILGGANLIADGFSMAVSNYLGSRARSQQRGLARRAVERRIAGAGSAERQRIERIFEAKGFRGADLDRAVEVITSDPRVWLDTLMTDELGYSAGEPNALRAAASTLVAFLAVGFLPLAAFAYDLAVPGALSSTFAWSAAMTAAAFFIVGSLKARYVEQAWWRAGLETLAVGGLAAVLAYAVGAALQGAA